MAVYYVATTGSNGNSGAIGSPWLTIAYAVAQLSAGDTLFIRGGTYTGSSNVIDSAVNTVPSGTSGSRITIGGYPGETVTITPPDGQQAIRLTVGAPAYLTVQDLTLDGINGTDIPANGAPDLIFLSTGAHHNIFQRLDVQRSSANGFGFSSQNGEANYNQILNCLIHDNGRLDFGNTGYGIYLKTSVNVIAGNEIFGNNGYGIQHNPAATFGNDNIIRANRIHDNAVHGTIGVGGETSYGIVISGGERNIVHSNLIYRNQGGILLYGGGGVQSKDTKVYNNTITGNLGHGGGGESGIDCQYYDSANPPLITNNIIWDNANADLLDYGQDADTGTADGTAIADTNICVVFAGITPTNNLTDDPLFTDAAGADYTLDTTSSPSSPAIDAGLTLSEVTIDFAGNARPAGAAYDLGAYESGATGGAGGVGESEGSSGSPGGGGSGETPAGPGAPAEEATGTVTDTYSDMDMQCPADWENGFKEGLITQWGDARRPSSHLFTGEWQGTTFDFQIADTDGRFRAQQASFTERYWNDPLTIRMTTRENRADLGFAFTVFCGPIIEAQPVAPRLFNITLGDVVSQGLLSDRSKVPWRIVRDSFLQQLDAISESLDRDRPEPILYGAHTRQANEETSPESSDGIRTTPIYLGLDTVGSRQYHVWMICGHATQDVEIYVDDVIRVEGSILGFPIWMIPHHPQHTSQFGTAYQDKVSDTYGTTRRYTLLYGRFGYVTTDACASGEMKLTAAVWGIEDVGDGSGSLITDRFDQYQHFLINYVANYGAESYQSGSWLDNPTWDLFDGPVSKVNEASFEAARAIGEDRLSTGYVGAAAIGAGPGDRASVKTWIADWNRSCACRFGINHFGQMHIFLVRPTAAIKVAAPLYIDAYEILDGSFSTELKWDEHATSIQYKADFEQATSEWLTSGVVEDTDASTNYGRTILSEPREYPFAPGRTQAEHLATLELRIRKHRPRYIVLDATIGPDPVTDDSLGYLDIGDYFRYVDFDAVQETRQERLAQVIEPVVRVGSRRTSVVAMDVEDLIDYDVDA